MSLALGATLLLAACSGDDGGGPPAPDLKVVSLNVLHGVTCPPETAFCRLADRIDLLFDLLVEAGCPEIVLLQEVLGPVVPLIEERAASRCPFPYHVLIPVGGQNFTLSRYPVLASNFDSLHGGIRLVAHNRIDHPLGAIDVFNTHLAAGVDRGPAPCGENCPAECVAAGAVSNRDCQAVQLAAAVAARHDLATPAVLAGDFNSPPDTFVYRYLTDQGYIDSFLAADNDECDPATADGCTCCRPDEELSGMESPANTTDRRIDYMFVIPPRGTASCDFRVDSRRDRDGDGFATRIFADEANPFATQCGPLPDPICWPSDHEGMQLDLNCAAR